MTQTGRLSGQVGSLQADCSSSRRYPISCPVACRQLSQLRCSGYWQTQSHTAVSNRPYPTDHLPLLWPHSTEKQSFCGQEGDFEFDAELLISLVEPRGVLWDKKDSIFKDRIEMKKALREVSACLQEDFEAAGNVKKKGGFC